MLLSEVVVLRAVLKEEIKEEVTRVIQEQPYIAKRRLHIPNKIATIPLLSTSSPVSVSVLLVRTVWLNNGCVVLVAGMIVNMKMNKEFITLVSE